MDIIGLYERAGGLARTPLEVGAFAEHWDAAAAAARGPRSPPTRTRCTPHGPVVHEPGAATPAMWARLILAALGTAAAFSPPLPNAKVGVRRCAATSAAVWYDAPPRRAVMAGNWKLNPATVGEARSLLANLASNTRAMGSGVPGIIVFPPYPYLSEAIETLEGSGVRVGACATAAALLVLLLAPALLLPHPADSCNH